MKSKHAVGLAVALIAFFASLGNGYLFLAEFGAIVALIHLFGPAAFGFFYRRGIKYSPGPYGHLKLAGIIAIFFGAMWMGTTVYFLTPSLWYGSLMPTTDPSVWGVWGSVTSLLGYLMADK